MLVLLAWIAVGALAGQRGIWQDEVQVMFRQFSASGSWWERVFLHAGTPARRLVGLPFRVGLWLGEPTGVLFAILTLGWLATGVLAHRLAARLWPSLPAAPFLAGVLTLTATGDFFTASLVTLHYVLAIALSLLAVLLLVDWGRAGGALRLAGACVSIGVAFFFVDAPVTVYALAPSLLWATDVPWRRIATASAAWYAAAIPYFAVVLPSLFDPTSYLVHATAPLAPSAWLARVADLVAYNLTPWRWAYARPLWFPREAGAVSNALAVGLIAAGTAAAAALVFWTRRSAEPVERPRARVAGVLVLLAVAANAAYASVVLSAFYCRTHLLSRVWVALLAAAGLGWLIERGTAARVIATGLGALLVALGLRGGLERQDYYAGHWRRHRAELLSLRAAAPGLTPDARVLLRVPAHEGFTATDAGYLARAWMVLLHGDPTLECRVVLWAEGRPNRCEPAPGGIVCRGERSPTCVFIEGRQVDSLPVEKLVWIEYDPAARRFARREKLPPPFDRLGTYDPSRLVFDRERPAITRSLMDRPAGDLTR
ncbi:MAG: hypothetical protein ABW221_17170 [Vicinamibacteria bacterium]